MRFLPPAILVSCLGLLTGCGTSRQAGSLSRLASGAGTSGSLVFGTGDYAAGTIRLSFLLLRASGRAVARPYAQIWFASSLSLRPTVQARASYESVTAPGARASALGTTHLYVAHVRLAREGSYWLLVRPVGGPAIHALARIVVNGRSASLPVDAPAPRTTNPTIASSGGTLTAITTHAPPDRALLAYSIAGSLAARRPFVVVFAIPKLCLNRACGPIVDVVEAVRRRFGGEGVRFIHVEPFRDNDPSRGRNGYARQWRIPSVPFTFLVNRDGRIKAKFEGSVSVGELSAAVRSKLLT